MDKKPKGPFFEANSDKSHGRLLKQITRPRAASGERAKPTRNEALRVMGFTSQLRFLAGPVYRGEAELEVRTRRAAEAAGGRGGWGWRVGGGGVRHAATAGGF